MNQWKFSRAKPCKGEEFDPELIEEADQYRKQAKNMLEKLKKELFSRKPASFINDMKEMQGVLKSLIELVKIFAKQYSLKKTEKGLVDFADLEHLCLEILLNKESQVPAPSEIALIYRNQFKEVMVDEYQDVNLVQETILRLVTAAEENEGNLFMVGDVKQSIYRFRLAEPNLFLDKYLRFTPEGKDSGLLKVKILVYGLIYLRISVAGERFLMGLILYLNKSWAQQLEKLNIAKMLN